MVQKIIGKQSATRTRDKTERLMKNLAKSLPPAKSDLLAVNELY